MKILALCDSPTLSSGFARVAQNLFRRWASVPGVQIHCWGIGFEGWSYRRHSYVTQLMPAGGGGEWCSPKRLQLFLHQLALKEEDYTHVWIMQDTFQLCVNGFPEALASTCDASGIRSLLYFPVDATFDKEWTDIVAAVDVPVAYTEYGRSMALRMWRQRVAQEAEDKKLIMPDVGDLDIAVLPHGVDRGIYRHLPDRQASRAMIKVGGGGGQPWLGADDFLMLNVNANQRRKDPTRSLELLRALLDRGVPAKLLMHMEESSEGISLEAVGRQLGLVAGEHWAHTGTQFRNGQGLMGEEGRKGQPGLVDLYNAADLYLTTTLGEGWGLGMTEALACGTPVAAPDHTSCREIADELVRLQEGDCFLPLGLESNGIVTQWDNSRWRRRVDVGYACEQIKSFYDRGRWRERVSLCANACEWLNWDRIAAEFLRLMKGGTL